MSSKKKENGCTSVRCVEHAIRKYGRTVEEFFISAVRAENAIRLSRGRKPILDENPETFARMIEAEINRFFLLKTQGIAANSRYKIPEYVIAFAETIVANPPSRFHKDRKGNVRPPPFMARAY